MDKCLQLWRKIPKVLHNDFFPVPIHTFPEVNGSYIHASKVDCIPKRFTGKFDNAKINRGLWQHASVKVNAHSVSSAALVQERGSLPEALLSDAHRTLAHLSFNISTALGRKSAKLPKCDWISRRSMSSPVSYFHLRSLSQGNLYVD